MFDCERAATYGAGKSVASAHGGDMSTTSSVPLCPHVEHLVHIEGISSRERDVLALLAVGADDKTIAGELNVSHRTVRAHITALFLKLQVRNRTEVALLGQFAHLRMCEACRRRVGAEPPASAHGAC